MRTSLESIAGLEPVDDEGDALLEGHLGRPADVEVIAADAYNISLIRDTVKR